MDGSSLKDKDTDLEAVALIHIIVAEIKLESLRIKNT